MSDIIAHRDDWPARLVAHLLRRMGKGGRARARRRAIRRAKA